MHHFNEYQDYAAETAVYPSEDAFTYLPLQLCAEAGEVAGKIAKAIRKGEDFDTEAVAQELGDVLWYVSNLAYELDIDLADIAKMNIEKLQSRMERGVLHGNGDNR